MTALDNLKQFLDGEYAKDPELIDGFDPRDFVSMIDLSVGHSPVIHDRYPWPPMGNIPQPDKPKRDGLRYYLAWPASQRWEWLTEESHKLMRARFLFWRGLLYRTFDGFSHPEKAQIVAWYFDGAMWRPEQDSALYKAMGLV